ncbi:MAG: putative bifunctional diguanylate cyclase/phosphodiesterase [Desulfovibrio sp.]
MDLLLRTAADVAGELLRFDEFYAVIRECSSDDICHYSTRGKITPLTEILFKRCYEAKAPVLLDHITLKTIVKEHAELVNVQVPFCWLGIPLFGMDDEYQGVIAIEQTSLAEGYGTQDTCMLMYLADHLVLAIDHFHSESALRDSEARFRGVFEKAAMGILRIGLDGKILEGNTEALSVLEHSSEALRAMHFIDVHEIKMRAAAYERFSSLLLGEQDSITAESVLVKSDGTKLLVRSTISLVTDQSGSPQFILKMFEDITHQRNTEEKLQRQITYDGLTDLPNRMLLSAEIEQIIESPAKDSELCGVLLLDIDRFRVVNDSLGHDLGDLLICLVAGRLEEFFADDGFLARFGNDTFALLLKRKNQADYLELLAAVKGLMLEPFVLDGREVYITLTCGVVLGVDSYHDPYAVMRDVDIALHGAKAKGRSSFEFFDGERHHKVSSALALENDIRKGINDREFIPYYQPVVQADNGQVIGFEALARWDRPGEGVVAPAAFIDIAEEAGLIHAIDFIILQSACWALKDLQTIAQKPLTMNVNFSSVHFHNRSFAGDVITIVRAAGCEPKHVRLEITESVFIQAGDIVEENMQALRDAGFNLVMDDFGTGYSSLSYLHMFPLHTVKIDQSFTSGLPSNKNSTNIIRSIMALCRDMGCNVVAEGAETVDQVNALQLLGCQHVQGYYYSKPVSLEGAKELLRNGTLPLEK